MDKQTVDNAIQFLMRCELKGAEVPAFNEVMQWLHEMKNHHDQDETE